jgi:formylglycine-generating enzyme
VEGIQTVTVPMSLKPILSILSGLLVLSLLLDATTSHAQGFEELKKGVVKINAQADGKVKIGTGFIVKLDSEVVYIVTAAHVVSGDPQPRVQFFRQETQVQAYVKHAEGGDEVTFLALLAVRGKGNIPTGLAPLPLATATRVTSGEDIMVIGHPREAGDWAILKGSIASRQGRYLTVDANIDEGNSGGPIIHSGQVVGLIGGAQRYGKGVTVGTVREYLEGHGVVPEERASPSIAKSTPPSSQPTQSTPNSAREITGKDGAPMTLIPAGSFLMGSTKDEVDRAIKDCVKELGRDQQTCDDWFKPELPQHKVQIGAFYFDTYEVTNRLFQQFTRQTGYRTTAERIGSARAFVEGKGWEEVKGANWQKPEADVTVFDSNRAEHPVVSVSWDDAQAYCRWADKRLPTEAEWEYAARAGTTTKYWWGHGNPGARRVENIADEAAKKLLKTIMSGYDDGSVRTAPVGSYEANPWGLHDISGNASEWTADWYGEDYYGKSPARNPTGPSGGEYRVVPDGSWVLAPVNLHSANRYRTTPSTRHDLLGFRCAQDVPK